MGFFFLQQQQTYHNTKMTLHLFKTLLTENVMLWKIIPKCWKLSLHNLLYFSRLLWQKIKPWRHQSFQSCAHTDSPRPEWLLKNNIWGRHHPHHHRRHHPSHHCRHDRRHHDRRHHRRCHHHGDHEQEHWWTHHRLLLLSRLSPRCLLAGCGRRRWPERGSETELQYFENIYFSTFKYIFRNL